MISGCYHVCWVITHEHAQPDKTLDHAPIADTLSEIVLGVTG